MAIDEIKFNATNITAERSLWHTNNVQIQYEKRLGQFVNIVTDPKSKAKRTTEAQQVL